MTKQAQKISLQDLSSSLQGLQAQEVANPPQESKQEVVKEETTLAIQSAKIAEAFGVDAKIINQAMINAAIKSAHSVAAKETIKKYNITF